MKIKIAYEIEDGYVGPSAPQYVTADTMDFHGMTPAQIEEQIAVIVQEDFEQKVTWFVSGGAVPLVDKIVGMLEAEADEE